MPVRKKRKRKGPCARRGPRAQSSPPAAVSWQCPAVHRVTAAALGKMNFPTNVKQDPTDPNAPTNGQRMFCGTRLWDTLAGDAPVGQGCQNIRNCACHEICTSSSLRYIACHEICTSRCARYFTHLWHEICTSRPTKYRISHEICTSRSTKRRICTSRSTNYFGCHENPAPQQPGSHTCQSQWHSDKTTQFHELSTAPATNRCYITPSCLQQTHPHESDTTAFHPKPLVSPLFFFQTVCPHSGSHGEPVRFGRAGSLESSVLGSPNAISLRRVTRKAGCGTVLDGGAL